ncbi:MAG: choice-of-anchor B family protein, partial [Bacteroidota bacterium]
MKRLLVHLFFILLSASSWAQNNIQLAAQLTYQGSALANIGGYVDSLGNEYALVGTDFGLSIVDVTVPTNPVIRFTVPGPTNDWREVKTYRKTAYITTEGGGGLTVVDMSRLPGTINYHQYTGDGAITGQLSSIHALHVDTTKGYLYLYGSNIGSGHTLFFNLSDPNNPVFAGQYIYPGGGNSSYVHDGYADNDTLYEGHIYSGFFTIVDVRNKSNPVLIATQQTPTSFTHNTWLSNDKKTLFTTDENSGSYLGAYDISDPFNIHQLSRFQTAPGSGSIIHNTHILNDFAITSWYKEGVVITDVSRPDNPIEVGHYDTYPQGSGNGFSGCWGVYPFLPSGTIVASDINNGLFVLTPTYVRGCYLEGMVTDSITGALINGASVQIVTPAISKTTDLSGKYRSGISTPATIDLIVSKPGYYSKTVSGITLSSGVVTIQDIQLLPVQTIAVEGLVVDSLTGAPIANADVRFFNSDFDIRVTTDAQGVFILPSIVDNTYELTCGIWGYQTTCRTIQASAGPFSIGLMQGYQDDFTFDYGWLVQGTTPNQWERGEPIGTYDNQNNVVNPEFDATGDCGEICYVTDNAVGTFSSNDVDNGYTRLTSPVFDLTGYQNPVIEYNRWVVNIGGTGTPNDTLIIRLTNGTDTVAIDKVHKNSPGQGVWYPVSVTVSNYITPGPTMRLIVYAEDYSPGHVFEAGFDNFRVTGTMTTGLTNDFSGSDKLIAYP